MTTNSNPIPEPTSLTAVVVGKRNGVTAMAVRTVTTGSPWMLRAEGGCWVLRTWTALCCELTDIRVVNVPEVAAEINRLTDRVADLEAAAIYAEGVHQGEMASQRARLEARIAELEDDKPEPGPWLRGDELKAVMPTLKADDEVGVGYKGHTASGKLWPDRGLLVLGAITVRTISGKPGLCVDALRIIERAPEPEPGANIPDEVVAAAMAALYATDTPTDKDMRAALAAADAKRAELAGGVA